MKKVIIIFSLVWISVGLLWFFLTKDKEDTVMEKPQAISKDAVRWNVEDEQGDFKAPHWAKNKEIRPYVRAKDEGTGEQLDKTDPQERLLEFFVLTQHGPLNLASSYVKPGKLHLDITVTDPLEKIEQIENLALRISRNQTIQEVIVTPQEVKDTIATFDVQIYFTDGKTSSLTNVQLQLYESNFNWYLTTSLTQLAESMEENLRDS